MKIDLNNLPNLSPPSQGVPLPGQNGRGGRREAWTLDQEAIVRGKAGALSAAQIGALIGKSACAVRVFASLNKISLKVNRL